MMRTLLFCFLMLSLATSKAQQINEFQPNPFGGDPASVSFEILGTPGATFTGFVLSLESDGSSIGSVDRSAAVSGTFDANGILNVMIPDLENPSFTVVLSSLDPLAGTDLDTDDDGNIDDPSVLGTVYDAIGIPDNTSDEANLYGAQLGGQDFNYTGDEPQLVFRDPDTGAWIAVNDPMGTDVYLIDASTIPVSSFVTSPDITTFGAINTAQSAPLPVTLTAFSAKATTSGAMLEWTTASEENNHYFSVEMSRDAAVYSESAKVSGNGTTESFETYSYEYNNLTSGTYYFRLRQVDFDGQASFSEVVSLTITGDREFHMINNNAHDFVQVDVSTPRPVRILNMAGAVVSEHTLSIGRNTIDVSTLANGMYILTDGINAKRFVK